MKSYESERDGIREEERTLEEIEMKYFVDLLNWKGKKVYLLSLGNSFFQLRI